MADLAQNPGSPAMETTFCPGSFFLDSLATAIPSLCHLESKMLGSLLLLSHSPCCSWNTPFSPLCPAHSCPSFRSPFGRHLFLSRVSHLSLQASHIPEFPPLVQLPHKIVIGYLFPLSSLGPRVSCSPLCAHVQPKGRHTEILAIE